MASAGRKPALTPEVQKDLVDLLEKGATIKDACASIPIDEATFFKWMKRGSRESTGIYFEFRKSITRARAKMRVEAVDKLRQLGMEGNAKALAFLLERSDPENWGKRSTIKIEGGVPVDLINTLIRAMIEQGLDVEQAVKDMIAELAEGL